MSESRVFDRSGNKRFAEMNNQSILEKDGKCQNGISLSSRPLRVTGLKTADSITVAAWVRLEEVKYIVHFLDLPENIGF